VNISNVAGLIDANGKPHYKYIVEGANLFFTQQARLYLEKRKAILFKDSSANKGKIPPFRFDLHSHLRHRWRNKLLVRSFGWPSTSDGGLHDSDGLQGWQTIGILPDLREGNPSKDHR